MGRHRSAPLGRIVRSALIVLAVGAVATLLVVGVRALIGSPGAQPERPASTATALARPSEARVPTVRIECVADVCPTVTVRVPGGDVLQHREMSGGEEVSYFEPELDVVLGGAGTVRVTENGSPRAPKEKGTRESFTVRGPGG
ncbi:hypothetical protein [Nonomuraea sp. WAC 01424]|uniref:hypothetical protein n=1 Tax=Nonomuraea sp. WAC 01424 TaxID=2203200 RepID=UPI000F7B4842|nr:hypothetical protein [Nonomuraea sp. WAC 01424]